MTSCADDGQTSSADVLPIPSSAVAGSTNIEVSGAFVRPVEDTAHELYFSLTNHADADDRVVGIEVDGVGSVRILGTDGACDNDTVDIQLASSLEVPALGSTVLRPGGCRVLLEGAPADAAIAVHLQFAGGLVLEFSVPVKST